MHKNILTPSPPQPQPPPIPCSLGVTLSRAKDKPLKTMRTIMSAAAAPQNSISA